MEIDENLYEKYSHLSYSDFLKEEYNPRWGVKKKNAYELAFAEVILRQSVVMSKGLFSLSPSGKKNIEWLDRVLKENRDVLMVIAKNAYDMGRRSCFI